jgi:ATPase subunit of ABC transporter with duplicated ATPase domains
MFRNMDFHVDASDRIALLGEKDNENSILAKSLSNQLVHLPAMLPMQSVRFSQQQTDELNVESCLTTILSSVIRQFSETQARSHLTWFGIAHFAVRL